MISVGFLGPPPEARKNSTIFLLLDLDRIIDDITLLRVRVEWFGFEWDVDQRLRSETLAAREPASLQEHHDLTLISFLFFIVGGRALLLVLLVGFVLPAGLVLAVIMSHRRRFEFISANRQLPFN